MRGRKANTERSIRWRVEVREKIAAQVELLLLDPVTQQIEYGARSALINRLLEAWLDSQRKRPEVEETEEDRAEARGDYQYGESRLDAARHRREGEEG
jgi:hypothetical protein